MKKRKTIVTLTRYHPTLLNGLDSTQVNERINHNLTNAYKERSNNSYLNIVKKNLFSIFNCVLYLVAIVYAICWCIYPSDSSSTSPYIYNNYNYTMSISRFTYLGPLICNIIIGIFQEVKAKKIVDKLKLVDRQRSTVIRNGKEETIFSDDIVLDDIVVFKAGNTIVIDGPIIDGSCQTNESMLTGESNLILKHIGDSVYAGTFVVSGCVTVRADKVGKDTSSSIIQHKLKSIKKKHSQLMKSLNSIINTIAAILIPLTLATAAQLVCDNFDIIGNPGVQLYIVQTVGAIIIGSIPTGLILLTSTTLATSIIKLSMVHTVIKDLYSVENLSRVDTICFDKTGTLTTGNLNVVKYEELGKLYDFNSLDLLKNYLGALPNDNATSIAMNNKFGQANDLLVSKITLFSSITKCTSVEFSVNKEIIKLSLGAPEYLTDNEDLLKKAKAYNVKGLRTILLVAYDKYDSNKTIPLMLIILEDEIRGSINKTVKYFYDNGVNIKVISGDSPDTVSAIAKVCGIKNADRAISLEGMSDSQIFDIIDNYTIFARVSPDQKKILVEALQKTGHNVCMTGDGINDIIAMQQANASVSFRNATDVTKSIADIVLLDNDFSHMETVIREGRRSVNNMQRVSSMFLMKSFFTIGYQFLMLLTGSVLSSMSIQAEFYQMLSGYIIGFAGVLLSFEGNYDRYDGNFTSHVMSRAIPGALFLLLAVISADIINITALHNATYTLTYATGEVITAQMWKPLVTILFTLCGFAILFKQCYPLNKYRLTTFCLSFVTCVCACIMFPNNYLGWQAIKMDSLSDMLDSAFICLKDFPNNNFLFNGQLTSRIFWLSILGFVCLAIPMYFLFYWAVVKIKNIIKLKVIDKMGE